MLALNDSRMTGGEPSGASRSESATRRRLRLVVRAFVDLLPLTLLLFVALEWNGIPGQGYRASLAYLDAGMAARVGAPLYDPEPVAAPHEFVGKWPYLYPPPLAAVLSFLPPLDYPTFDRLWLILNVLALCMFGASLARIRDGRWSIRGAWIWSAAVFATPGAAHALHFGNVEPLIWALVGVGFSVPTVAGAALALGAAFKVTPAWAWLTFVSRRPGRHVPSTAAATVGLTALSAWVFGARRLLELCREWITAVLPSLSQGQFWGGSIAVLRDGIGPLDVLGNVSLSFLPVQLAALTVWDYQGGPLPAGARLFLTGVGLGLPLLLLWRLRFLSLRMQAAVVLCVAALVSPITRIFTLPLLLLPLAIHRAERDGLDDGDFSEAFSRGQSP